MIVGPSLGAALDAAWAAGHPGDCGLGATAGNLLATVDRINRSATATPLRIGRYRVGGSAVPYYLFAHLHDDSTASYAGVAADVAVLARTTGTSNRTRRTSRCSAR